MGQTVGIFSGSFNPIHLGHIAIARYMVEKEKLDEIWFLATPQNPLKKRTDLLDDKTREQLTLLAIKDMPAFRYCDIEKHLPLPSYTITTLRTLSRRYPDKNFCLLIGSDNWTIFDQWQSPQEILAEYTIYIYPRPGYPVDAATLPSSVHLTQAPMMDISSTEIRRRIAAGESVTDYLPPAVLDHIVQHRITWQTSRE
ncbi:MAG: nicotinate-nucleotide adenylyltransferase [Porphyromonadaceae bacterium]|nr:nicotinate-nucleotide adenylyltransferase [Porphyromonadaceae bacterium]